MSPAMLKMWISVAGMGFMFLAIALIYVSRYKLTGFFKIISAVFAYLFMIVAGFTLLIVLMP